MSSLPFIHAFYRSYARCIACLCCCLLLANSNADVVDGFYEVVVPVGSTSDKDMQASAGVALQNMLIRASGTELILQNEMLQRALSEPKDYISQFGLLRDDVEGQERLQIKFTFSAHIVDQLLLQAGEPIWTKDRPSSLVWLAIDEARELRTAGEGDPAYTLLEQRAKLKGLPIITPLHDLEDRFAVTPDQIWQFDIDAIEQASDRYSFNNVIVARALNDSQNQWHTTWELLKDQSPLLGNETCTELVDCFDEALGKISARWSERYGVIKSFSRADKVLFTLKNASFEDVSLMSAYWRSLPAIDSFNVVSIIAKDVNFELIWRSDTETLIQLLGLNDALIKASESSEAKLVYEWN